ncbi:MAG: hypothetical protein CO189_11660 [candidate division Zixibacteria bacterium CG_4_9_14_3_um_filter_46_8]|nr:MAG: hypothetical protein CO189_11660 [candidate division Zixibacteria bacterium CG_4_9_14_3_um_filter_46_8]
MIEPLANIKILGFTRLLIYIRFANRWKLLMIRLSICNPKDRMLAEGCEILSSPIIEIMIMLYSRLWETLGAN